MHEMSLMADLMRKVESVARREGGRVVRVKVIVGALCHCSAEHFREHFEHAAAGTLAEGAALEVEQRDDPTDAHAQDVLLESVEVAEPGQDL
jgi:hydrogenase nickel incorporation protein HypA/HybF